MAHSTRKTNSQDPSTNIWIAAMPVAFVFLWSTGFIGAKYGIPYAEPFTFLGIRFTVVIGLMPLVCLVTKAPWPKSVKATIHIVIAGTLVNRVYLGGVFSSVKVGFPVGISALVTGVTTNSNSHTRSPCSWRNRHQAPMGWDFHRLYRCCISCLQ